MTAKLPSRLHHTAYVTKDMEATREFYVDVRVLPLQARWSVTLCLFAPERTSWHCVSGFGDGGALAFFQFADKEDEKLFVPDMPATPFVHLALKVDEETQKEMEERIVKAGLEATYTLEHGYCRSVYVVDPNGMTVEFCCDDPQAEVGAEERRAKAHAELKRWLAGDHSTNNDFRHAEAA